MSIFLSWGAFAFFCLAFLWRASARRVSLLATPDKKPGLSTLVGMFVYIANEHTSRRQEYLFLAISSLVPSSIVVETAQNRQRRRSILRLTFQYLSHQSGYHHSRPGHSDPGQPLLPETAQDAVEHHGAAVPSSGQVHRVRLSTEHPFFSQTHFCFQAFL